MDKIFLQERIPSLHVQVCFQLIFSQVFVMIDAYLFLIHFNKLSFSFCISLWIWMTEIATNQSVNSFFFIDSKLFLYQLFSGQIYYIRYFGFNCQTFKIISLIFLRGFNFFQVFWIVNSLASLFFKGFNSQLLQGQIRIKLTNNSLRRGLPHRTIFNGHSSFFDELKLICFHFESWTRWLSVSFL